MHFRAVPAALVLAFSALAMAAPVPLEERGLSLERRAVAITFTFDPKGDFQPIVPPTPLPTDPKPSNSQTSKFNKQQKVFAAKTTSRNTLLGQVQPRMQAVINAAQTTLSLPATLSVNMKSTFHKSDDPESHATFSFTAPSGPCAAGCVGHAYNPTSEISPGKGQPGKIFDASHNTVFGAADV